MQKNKFLYTIKFSPPSLNKPGNLEIKIVHKENDSDFITISWEGENYGTKKKEWYECKTKWDKCNIKWIYKTHDLLPAVKIIKKLKINSSTSIQEVVDALEAHNIKIAVYINLINEEFYSGIISMRELYDREFTRAGKMFIIPRNQQIDLICHQKTKVLLVHPVCMIKLEPMHFSPHTFANKGIRRYTQIDRHHYYRHWICKGLKLSMMNKLWTSYFISCLSTPGKSNNH